MKNTCLALLLSLAIFEAGCSAKMRNVAVVGLISGGVGAGIGYTFLHHGREKEYRTVNTIMAGSILAVVGAGISYWHQTSLEDQKIDLASKFSRGAFLEKDSSQGYVSSPSECFSLTKQAVKLDESTRWVIPEFRKRDLPSQRDEQELVSSHYTWEMARPGFFITRDADPAYFEHEEGHDAK